MLMQAIDNWLQVLGWGFLALVPGPVTAWLILRWLVKLEIRENMNGGHGPLNAVVVGHMLGVVTGAVAATAILTVAGAIFLVVNWAFDEIGLTANDMPDFISSIPEPSFGIRTVVIFLWGFIYAAHYGCVLGHDVAGAEERIKRGEKFKEIKL